MPGAVYTITGILTWLPCEKKKGSEGRDTVVSNIVGESLNNGRGINGGRKKRGKGREEAGQPKDWDVEARCLCFVGALVDEVRRGLVRCLVARRWGREDPL